MISIEAFNPKPVIGIVSHSQEGYSANLILASKPSQCITGYCRDDHGAYKGEGQMTFCEAIVFAEQIRKNQTFAKAKAPRSVEVHSLTNHIACAKIIVWWGVVYALLSRGGDG